MTAPQQNLSDERLAWLAVRAELTAESTKDARSDARLLMLLKLVLGHIAFRSRDAEAIMDNKMKTYAVAVDELSRRLTREDRVVLRETGRLPAWFLPTVKVEAHNVKLGGSW